LSAIAGSTLSRLIVYARFSIKHRPDVVLGFHLLLNGLIAKILANVTKRRSVYICGGGKREFDGGGYATENRLYRQLGKPSRYVESRLLEFVKGFDLTVVMGSSVSTCLNEDVKVNGMVMINPGGYDESIYHAATVEKQFDLILVGRLSAVKQVDTFLKLVAKLRSTMPRVNAVIVGDGPSRQELEALAQSLGLSEAVTFTGSQPDVASWLKLSRLFVLTSASEGVSQAMIQAMMCGLPAVVPDVGDLADCVETEHNGYLVAPDDIDAFESAATKLLSNEDYCASLGLAAATTGSQYTYGAAAKLWDHYFDANVRSSDRRETGANV